MIILAIGAHFDDVELGCGGTLLKHNRRDDELHILVVTHSGYTSKVKAIVRSKTEALEEGKRSAAHLKARLHCLNLEPINILPTEQNIIDLEERILSIRPDIVYTHQPNDSNADHAAVGYMSMRACRKCDRVLLYRSNWYILDDSRPDNYYVDITEYMGEKESLIRYFDSEMRNVNYSWVDFVKKQNCASGAKIGVGYAETFHAMKIVER
jgi:LmbE family N-acetylglucosaminyl deacetylase